MADIDREPHNKQAALSVHNHRCPECGIKYSCRCSEQDRREKLVCVRCEGRTK